MTTHQNLLTSSEKAFGASARPALKYVGLALMLAWHYTLWFVPDVFYGTELLAESVTSSWLIMLGASVATLFLIPLILGRKRYLSSHRWLIWGVPIVLSVGTLYITLIAFTLDSSLSAYAISAVLGIGSAIYWILWGEFYAQKKLPFSILHVGPVVALTLLVSLFFGSVFFAPFSSLWAALLPLVSGIVLSRASKSSNEKTFPVLLPASVTKEGTKTILAACLISFVASVACYFLVAIIPWEVFSFRDQSFTLGVVGGAFLMLIIAGISKISRGKNNVFQALPWLLVCIVVALALFLADESLYFIAFILALAVASVFEILLAMYFGILTTKGYVAPALAFGLSGGSIRAGIALGNSLALYYESQPELASVITPETALLLLCILVVLLIPLVRQEYRVVKLTSEPPEESDLDMRCRAVAQEFKLSPREAEIMMLLARGYTAERIARKLFISPHTVNTHIRHIYEKMSIHKRSELLNYINMHKTDY